jgi:hypothetical protein
MPVHFGCIPPVTFQRALVLFHPTDSVVIDPAKESFQGRQPQVASWKLTDDRERQMLLFGPTIAVTDPLSRPLGRLPRSAVPEKSNKSFVLECGRLQCMCCVARPYQ